MTVIQEKNSKQRNALLLGATAFVLMTAIVSWGVSLFQKDLFIASIGGEYPLSSLIDAVPMQVDEVEPEKKNDDEGGGGGGGGKDQQDPVSLGDLANQTPNPVRPPSATTYRSDDTELKLPIASTEGKRQFEQYMTDTVILTQGLAAFQIVRNWWRYGTGRAWDREVVEVPVLAAAQVQDMVMV